MALSNPPIAPDVNENWLFQFTADNNNSMEFLNGDNNYLNFGDILAEDDGHYDSWTVELWIWLDTTGAKPILSLGFKDSPEASETNIAFNLSIPSGDDLTVSYEYGSGSAVSEQDTDFGMGTGTWTHICATRNNADDKIRMYKNGALVHTSSATTDPSGGDSSSVELLVGRNQNYASGTYFNGKMAHIRIWNIARTDQEISNHYQTVVDNTATGLVAYWKLDEGVGDTVYDSSTNSNNGAVKNNNKVAGPGDATVWANGSFTKHIYAFGLAFRDTVVDNNFYHGSVLNKNISLRESIDITLGTSSTSNITLTSANFETQGTEFYKTLLNNAERNYINRKVVVYAQFFNEDTLSDCQKIFTGRLVDIQLNQDGNVTMQINSHRPWDGISFPQTQTTNGIYQPTVYGDYTIHGDKDLVRDQANAVFPVPFKRKSNTTDFLIVAPLASSDIRPCYYDATADAFLGIKADHYTATTKNLDSDYDANTNIGIVKREMRRRFRINPVSLSQDADTTFTTAKNLLMDSYGVQGIVHDFVNTQASQAKNFYANFAAELGKVNDVDLDIKGTVTTPGQSGTVALTLRISYSGSSGDYFSGNVAGSFSAVSLTNGSLANSESESSTDYATIGLSISNNNINTVNLSSTISSSGADRSLTLTITDFVMYLDVQHSYDEDAAKTNVSIANLSSLKYLYLPIDGLTALWDDGAISHGHDAHRDLLQRFAGIPSTDPEVNSGEAWSVLNTDRAIDNWKIRYWQLEPVLLKDILDKLAYEFGFVAKFTADEKMKYIYIKKSSELTATLNLTKMDINKINISTTGINNIVTQMDISNKLHPADASRYYATTNALNNTSRVKYNLGDKEGIKTLNLDTNVGTIPTTADADCNADFYSYYNNIVGDIKILVQCDVVNPMKGCQLETGDIVTFTDMPVEMFGTDFSNSTYFMIVDLNRSPGKVSITAREVG
tara:strand:- start:4229 stop:7084 length:2856 start_codon:yes stop_codon:yes gene_type:complete